MTTYQHKDALGQVLAVGDNVVFSNSSNMDLHFGVITKITSKRVKVDSADYWGAGIRIPKSVFKTDADCVEDYIRRNNKSEV